jgi:hypothetical protein
MKRELFVGSVDSSTQAASLIEAGATLIGVSVSSDDPASMERYRGIARDVGYEFVGALLEGQPLRTVRELQHLPAFVEFDRLFEFNVLGRSEELVASECRALGVPVRMAGLWLDYDEDPAWLQAQIHELPALDRLKYVIAILPSLRDPFDWLRNEAGKFDEDVVPDDILALCPSRPVSLATNWASQGELS